MRNIIYITILTVLFIFSNACQKKNVKGMYEYDTAFFAANGIEYIELSDSLGQSRVLIVPAYQGRVMTSSAKGKKGISYGWINYDLIESKEIKSNFNPVGGEERFWLGPEGGPYSLYFDSNKEQVFSNWRVPSLIDTESFDVVEKSSGKIKFSKQAVIENANGTLFKIDIQRSVSLLEKNEVEKVFNIEIEKSLNFVAYKSENCITNIGKDKWDKKTGVPSIWMLSMFDVGKSNIVFIPYKSNAVGSIVKDDYFGKVPSERLVIENDIIYFKVDGKLRSKIGIPFHRAKNILGSIDIERNLLTLMCYNLPETEESYVNGQWGNQEDAFNGDVINSYNDGPVEDGTIMGPFYELETSSPALDLCVGEKYKHEQCIVHIEGSKREIEKIISHLFEINLEKISTIF